MSFLIVSGLSGSGKSIALEALEDIGFYCIDNLPVTLLPHLASEIREAATAPDLLSGRTSEASRASLSARGPRKRVPDVPPDTSPIGEGRENAMRKVAVGLDARSRDFVRSLSASLAEVRKQNLKAEILFLAADDSVLIKRFQETRRRHPLTDENTPLVEGIRRERAMLEALASDAALRLDTTHMTPHELRHMVQNFARAGESPGLTVLFESFGYKNGTPNDADYVFDVRCLPNPYWKVELRKQTGMDAPVIAWLESDLRVGDMAREISGFLERWLPAFESEHRSYLTVAIGCTGGQHRSVYLVNRLAEHFAARGVKTLVRHRELK